MTKQEYMAELQEKLERFGRELQEEILEDYRQHFAEGESEGKSEEEIVKELGNIEEMIRELSEEDLSQDFSQRAAERGAASGKPGQGVGADAMGTEMKSSFSYSGHYKSVVMECRIADLRLECSEDDQIHVDYEAKGRASMGYEYYQYEKDGAFCAGIRRRKGVRDEDDGGEKMVKVTLFDHTIISYGRMDDFGGGQISLTVRIPRGMPKLTVKTGGGSIHASGLELQSLEGSSGSGNLEIETLKAERIEGHTGSGNILVEHSDFVSAVLKTGSGNVKAEQVRAREVKASAGSGNVRIDAAVAEYRLSAGSGNVRLKAAGPTERVSLSAGSGDIRLELEGAGGMEATVGTGSGSARIAWGEAEPQKVKNGTYAYGDSSCKVDAVTGSGSIRLSGK